jgi:hypothetical protein
MAFHIGFLVFPNITELDMAGPFEVFRSLPAARWALRSRIPERAWPALVKARAKAQARTCD